MYRGGVVDASSLMPSVITHSTGEAEYCTAALAIMAGAFTRKTYNEAMGRDADAPLTIALGIDSKAAIDIASSQRETKRTRHIQRRYHYFRECQAKGSIRIFHIEGTENWANGLTKPERSDQLDKEARIYQVTAPPAP